MSEAKPISESMKQIESDVSADVFDAMSAMQSSKDSVNEQSRRLTKKIMSHIMSVLANH